jgi:predicted metal-dependent phosphoesterase TrpH
MENKASATSPSTILSEVKSDQPLTQLDVLRIDLHCHSEASHDCSTPLESIPERCRQRGIHFQAITDHNQIWGAQKLKAALDRERINGGLPYPQIIIGEEVSTQEGEIIGLFLQEKIEAGLTPEESIHRIIGQGGLVLLPHGFDPLKRWRLTPHALERVAHLVNIVEAFNARVSRAHWNRVAAQWAMDHNLPMSAGSDAHTLADIGDAWVEIARPTIEGPHDLLAALIGTTPAGMWTHPVVAFVYKLWDRTWRRVVTQ